MVDCVAGRAEERVSDAFTSTTREVLSGDYSRSGGDALRFGGLSGGGAAGVSFVGWERHGGKLCGAGGDAGDEER